MSDIRHPRDVLRHHVTGAIERGEAQAIGAVTIKFDNPASECSAMIKPEPILLLSDARGVYIPRDFANEVKSECMTGVEPDDLECLRAGPDHEWYWEAWDRVCRDAVITDADGTRYTIYQDGDCWLLPEGMTVDDIGGFVWADAQ